MTDPTHSLKPDPTNIFTHATSELSQDAFLCWLLAHAHQAQAQAHPELHGVAWRLLDALCAKAEVEPLPRPCPVTVHRQVDKLDVLVLVGESHAILIEDKVTTENHSDQLVKYTEAIAKRHPGRTQVRIYLKTHDQASYAHVTSKEWVPFTRSDLLRVLRTGHDVPSDVYRQFLAHVERIDRDVGSHATTPPASWTRGAWTGFFMALGDDLGQSGWNYVPNRSGGFMGFWWGWQPVGDGYEVYLQLEEDTLVVKLKAPKKDDGRRGKQRDHWRDRVLMAMPGVRRPKKMGSGRWMTIAKASVPYLQLDDTGRLDLDETVAHLQRATAALADTVAAHRSE